MKEDCASYIPGPGFSSSIAPITFPLEAVPILAYLLPDLTIESLASYAPGPGLKLAIPGLSPFPIE